MCNKTDNSCRQEKLGCKGCYYENGIKYDKALYYKELIDTLIHTDFLEGACSEDSANEYKKAIKQLINENVELLKKNGELSFLVNCYTNEYFISKSEIDKDYISKDKIKEKLELLKDILKAKEKDGNIYMQIPIEYLKGAIEQLKDLYN